VNSKWKAGHKHIKVLDLEHLLSKSKKYSLPKIVSYFPCASALSISTKNQNIESYQEFTGCPTIKVLEFDSNYLLPSLRNCPKLKTLILAPSGDSPTKESLPTRNIITILNCLPSLEFLQIHQPCIWQRNTAFRSYRTITKLRLLNLDRDFIDEFIEWLSEGPRFSNLEELYLDLEYASMPENGIKVISESCPYLSTLKLRFATVPFLTIVDIFRNLKHLIHISFGQCKIYSCTNQWTDLFFLLLTSIPWLEALHFSGCELDVPENSNLDEKEFIFSESLVFPRLKSFKAFDINNEKVLSDDLEKLLKSFSNLKSLRCDVSASFVLPVELKGLETVELRHSKYMATERSPLKAHMHSSEFRSLKSLTLWSPYGFPKDIIVSSAANLVHICINYSISGSIVLEDASRHLVFPNLQTLEIRGISIAAQQMCIRFTNFFLQSSLPNLKKLAIDALTREEYLLETPALLLIREKSPHLQYLHLTGFSLPPDFFQTFKNAWPELRTMIIRNTNFLSITDEWTETEFFPFLENHRHLRTLNLSVKQVNLLTFEFMLSDATSLLALGQEKSKFADFYQRSSNLLQNSIFSMFSNHITTKYWWIKECVLLKF